jgi:phenylalanyl-tRNA synthetase beta chain
VLSILLTGSEILEGRAMPLREMDFYDAKGSVEVALATVGTFNVVFSPTEIRQLRRGQSAEISLDGINIGYVGKLNEELSAMYKFRQPVYIAELDLDTVLSQPVAPITYRPLPKYPSITRDVSLVAGREVTLGQIRDAIAAQGVELCRKVDFVDIYSGKGMGEDEVSITVRLEYRSDEVTLLDEDIDALHRRIIDAVTRELAVSQRI